MKAGKYFIKSLRSHRTQNIDLGRAIKHNHDTNTQIKHTAYLIPVPLAVCDNVVALYEMPLYKLNQ